MTAQAAVTSVVFPLSTPKSRSATQLSYRHHNHSLQNKSSNSHPFAKRARSSNSTQTQQKRCIQETATLPPSPPTVFCPTTKSDKSRPSHTPRHLRPRLDKQDVRPVTIPSQTRTSFHRQRVRVPATRQHVVPEPCGILRSSHRCTTA
jgi:hypothetical protein